MDLATIGHALSVWLIPVVVAITFHEAAHGWMAERCGDPTARLLGRVTFNPIKHVDPFGTLLLPGLLLLLKAPFLIGYAKPVPVDFRRLRQPKRDMVWVALAGPAVNVILAYASALALNGVARLFADGVLGGELAEWIGENLKRSMLINIVLAMFNMLPIPPLDGGRVVTGLLPDALAWRYARLERHGILVLLGVILLVPFVAERLGVPFNPIELLLLPPVEWAYGLVWRLAGLP